MGWVELTVGDHDSHDASREETITGQECCEDTSGSQDFPRADGTGQEFDQILAAGDGQVFGGAG